MSQIGGSRYLTGELGNSFGIIEDSAEIQSENVNANGALNCCWGRRKRDSAEEGKTEGGTTAGKKGQLHCPAGGDTTQYFTSNHAVGTAKVCRMVLH